MTFSFVFINNWKSLNPLDRPKEYLDNLSDQLYYLIIDEIQIILKDPFDKERTHDLREPWQGFLGWYPNFESKLMNYRIIYKVDRKVRIYRIGHHSLVYKK